jgi:hypothetical protein
MEIILFKKIILTPRKALGQFGWGKAIFCRNFSVFLRQAKKTTKRLFCPFFARGLLKEKCLLNSRFAQAPAKPARRPHSSSMAELWPKFPLQPIQKRGLNEAPNLPL